MSYGYRVLTEVDRSKLQLERIRALEADYCRAELALVDALSDAERDALAVDMQVIRQRLEPHYAAMDLGKPSPDEAGEVTGDGATGAGKPVPADHLRPAG